MVVSNLRIGDKVFSPLIPGGEADLVVALERHEALRGLKIASKDAMTDLLQGAVLTQNLRLLKEVS